MEGSEFEREELTDSEILERLRDVAVSTEPVPPEVLQAAYATFAWRVPNAELAELVCDSDAGDDVATTVPLEETSRFLTFQIPRGGAVELRAAADGDTFLLTGQVVPPRPGEVRVVHSAGTTAAPIDDRGAFAAPGIRRGPMRARLQLAGAPREIVTESVLL